jgi:hypothetical protein
VNDEDDGYYRQCQRGGCHNAVDGRKRFCSAKCRTADWKARRSAKAAPLRTCPHCGWDLRKRRGRPKRRK